MATELELKLVIKAMDSIDSYELAVVVQEMLENVRDNGEEEWDLDIFLEKLAEGVL